MDCPQRRAPMIRGTVELRTRAATRVLTGDHGIGTRLHFVGLWLDPVKLA